MRRIRILGIESLSLGKQIEHVWDSGLVVHRGPTCPFVDKAANKLILVPITLLFLARKARIATEYLVKTRAEASDDIIIIEDKYCVPRQRVSSVSVETLEDCPLEFNAAVHKHPSGLTRFSETDYQNINQNNDVSLLIADGKVVAATIREKMPCGELMIIDVDPANIAYYVPSSIEEARKKAQKISKELQNKLEQVAPLGEDNHDFLEI